MRVAFLGLGIMGQFMATNLVKAGHEVTVWNRTPGKIVEGAAVAPTPLSAAQGAEAIWLCVSDTDAVEEVIFGKEGAESSLAQGAIIADSSTISPSATIRFAERVGQKGAAWVDAPMTGSKSERRTEPWYSLSAELKSKWRGSSPYSRRWARRFSAWERLEKGKRRSLR